MTIAADAPPAGLLERATAHWRTRREPRFEERQAEGVFAVVDVETTGLDPTVDRIIECAIVELAANGAVLSEWATLVHVPDQGAIGASAIHGITRPMLERAPSFNELASELIARLQGRVIVGHVLEFDLAQLGAEFARLPIGLPDLAEAGLCTRDLARSYLPDQPHNLTACCKSARIKPKNLHSALGDARATAKLLAFFLAKHDHELIAQLRERAGAIDWPLVDRPTAHVEPRQLRSTRLPNRLVTALHRVGERLFPESVSAR